MKPDLKPPAVLRHDDLEVAKLIADEGEISRHPADYIEQLAQDIAANGLLQPIAVTEDNRVIFGHGRYLAVKLLGLKTVRAAVYAKGLAQLQFRSIRAAENLHRNDLTWFRKYLLCTDLLCGNPGWDQKTLAEFLRLSEPTVARMLSPGKCTEAWQQALKDGKVGITDIAVAASLPHAKQAALLEQKLNGATRDVLVESARRARSPSEPPAETVTRVRIPLAVATKDVSAHGTVTVAGTPGQEIGLRETETLLKEALRAVKDAQHRGLGTKAAQASWRDTAKATAG